MPVNYRILALVLTFSLLPLISGQTASPQNAERVRRRRQQFYRNRAYPAQSIPPGARVAALHAMDRMIATGPAWTMIGPQPTMAQPQDANFNGEGAPYASGRVNALAVDPRDPNVVYLGASGGGVWKTTDGGQNWAPLTDNQPSLVIGSIALAPSNPDIVYAGTGEDNDAGDSYYGAGILKSTDAGATWTQLAGPFVGPFSASRLAGGAHISALAVHPTDPNTVLAAVNRTPASAAGIYRTSDGGVTWTNVLGGADGTAALFNPADPAIAYAALGSSTGNRLNGVYKSSDGGVTWAASGPVASRGTSPTNVGRIALALAPSSPDVLYAGVQDSSNQRFDQLLGLYKSTDGAQTWNATSAPDYCAPQCDFDNVVLVHPTNPNVVVAAGLAPFRSLNGGSSWLNIELGADGFAVHTDHHALAFSRDARLYVGNDGGAWSTSSLTSQFLTWNNLNSTLALTEFSSNVSIDPSNPNVAYAGSQDNSVQMYSGGLAWQEVTPGDGGWTAIDAAIPAIWYGNLDGISPFQINGLTSLSTIWFALFSNNSTPFNTNGIALDDRSEFYAPMVMDPSNPLRLYYGTYMVYQSNDGAGSWAPISPDLTGTTNHSGDITAISVSPASPATMAAATSNGKLQVTTTATSGAAASWADRSSGLPGRSIAQIAFDPTIASTIYVAFSGFSGFGVDHAGHVFKSANLGQTWQDISGNLPNIPVNDIVVDPDQPNVLYAATDIGVFESADSATWTVLSTGLPRVLVQGLNLHRSSRTLRAATYGRSMWDLNVPLTGPSTAPHIAGAGPAANTISLTGANFTAQSVARWNGDDRPTSFVSSTQLSVQLTPDDLAHAGRGTVVVFNPSTGGGLSNSVNVPVGAAPAVMKAGPIVPGSIHSLFGTSLAPGTVTAAAPPLSNTLGDVTLELNGIPAPLFFVSPAQINFQAPWDLGGFGTATLTVLNGTLKSAPVQVNVALAAPAIFTADGSGTGQGIVYVSGPEVIAAPSGAFPGSRPAAHGETLEIYCTGLGPVSQLQTNGVPMFPPPAVAQFPTVTIGSTPAAVSFSGLAVGAVGLYQVNATVPAAAPSGDAVPLQMMLQGAASNMATIAVGP